MSVQNIPLDASETTAFVPPALQDVDGAPVFILKTPTRRDRRAFEAFLIGEGLRHHSKEAFRRETLAAITALWEADKAQEYHDIMNGFWSADDSYVEDRDAHEREQAELPEDKREPFPAFEWPDAEKVSLLTASIESNWPKLRAMSADNVMYQREQPVIFMAFGIKSWTGLETAVQRDAGHLTLECIDDMEQELAARWGDDGRIAVSQLAVAVINRMYVTKATEKNSPSPLQSSPSQKPMPMDGASQDGASPASAISDPTQETSLQPEASS